EIERRDLADFEKRHADLLSQVARRFRCRHASHAQPLPYAFSKLFDEARRGRAGAAADDHAVLHIVERSLRRVELGYVFAHTSPRNFARPPSTRRKRPITSLIISAVNWRLGITCTTPATG